MTLAVFMLLVRVLHHTWYFKDGRVPQEQCNLVLLGSQPELGANQARMAHRRRRRVGARL